MWWLWWRWFYPPPNPFFFYCFRASCASIRGYGCCSFLTILILSTQLERGHILHPVVSIFCDEVCGFIFFCRRSVIVIRHISWFWSWSVACQVLVLCRSRDPTFVDRAWIPHRSVYTNIPVCLIFLSKIRLLSFLVGVHLFASFLIIFWWHPSDRSN